VAIPHLLTQCLAHVNLVASLALLLAEFLALLLELCLNI
jgi:hypothetical protein